MNKAGKLVRAVEKIEILLAIVLFFAMLVACGMYIDIKINGQTSSLPPLPQSEKQILLKTGATENKLNTDDLIEPVFIGFKDGKSSVCATFDSNARKALDSITKPMLLSLFSGTGSQIIFDGDSQRHKFINELKQKDEFVLISYYDEIHASMFLPCLSDSYEIGLSPMYFGVKHLFVLRDEEGYLYGIALSKDGAVYEIRCEEKYSFDKFSAEEYDVSDGYSRFTFVDNNEVNPVLASSFTANKYELSPMSEVFGKSNDSYWVDTLFDIFSINENFVKSFSSKNNTEIIYVDGDSELLINDEGYVEYKSDSDGVMLEKYLDYSVDETGEYSFTDKVFAVKNIINSLKFNRSAHCYSVVGTDYVKNGDRLTVYLKSFVNGIAVRRENYDAVFVIEGNSLRSAQLYNFTCSESNEFTVCLNQKYVQAMLEDGGEMCYALMQPESDGKLYYADWAVPTENGEG